MGMLQDGKWTDEDIRNVGGRFERVSGQHRTEVAELHVDPGAVVVAVLGCRGRSVYQHVTMEGAPRAGLDRGRDVYQFALLLRAG